MTTDEIRTNGIRDVALDWFCSYVSKPHDSVKIGVKRGEAFSYWSALVCGVPQGLAIGPFLFILQINDLPNNCKHILCFLLADDTKLLYESSIYFCSSD